MNLDSLSFALSQISYSVANLTKKNYKSSAAEISHVSRSKRKIYLLSCTNVNETGWLPNSVAVTWDKGMSRIVENKLLSFTFYFILFCGTLLRAACACHVAQSQQPPNFPPGEGVTAHSLFGHRLGNYWYLLELQKCSSDMKNSFQA